jgi:hypothetical protein
MIKFIYLLLSITYAYSANWLMIQGTQKATAEDHDLWGFGQLRYTYNRLIYSINYTFSKSDAPYNSAAQSILDNAGDIARMQLTWVYK